MKNKKYIAHILTFITIIIWGTTFISTKVVLRELSPINILFYRFLVAYIALWLIFPKFKKMKSAKEEILFMALGLTGVTFYFLMENIALKYTMASNVGLLVSIAPILIVVVAHFFTKDEKFKRNFLWGFLIAITGVALVMFNGSVVLDLNPTGDILALLAALMWAFYSVLLKRVDKSYPVVLVVRKTFFYGLVGTLLIILGTGEELGRIQDFSINTIINMAFLGLVASALCYVLWNKAVSIIGAVKSSNYIYLIPVITMVTAKIILNEKITFIMLLGSLLIIAGVYIGEKGFSFRRQIDEKSDLAG